MMASDKVLAKAVRYRGSAVTSLTTTASLAATAAPLSPWVTGKRGYTGAPGPLQPMATISCSVTLYGPTQR